MQSCSQTAARAAYEIDGLAEHADREGNEKLSNACATLAFFFDRYRARLAQDVNQAEKDLDFYTWPSADVISLLGACEIVKQYCNPQELQEIDESELDEEAFKEREEKKKDIKKRKQFKLLWPRLLGVAPGGADAHADRSDLFGNALQIALYRTSKSRKHAKRAKSALGRQVMREYVQGLTELDSKQFQLTHASREQFEEAQATLKDQLEQPPEQQNQFLLVDLVTRLSRDTAAASLQDMLAPTVEEEEKRERERFERGYRLLRENLSEVDIRDRKEYRSLLIKSLVRAGEYEKAIGDAHKSSLIRQIESPNIPAPFFHVEDIDRFLVSSVIEEMPFDILVEYEDLFINRDFPVEAKVTVWRSFAKRYLEAENALQAYAQIMKISKYKEMDAYGDWWNILIERTCFQLTKKGEYKRSQELEALIVVSNTGSSYFRDNVRAHRAEAYAKNGMFEKAVQQCVQLEGEQRISAVRSVADTFIAAGQFVAAEKLVLALREAGHERDTTLIAEVLGKLIEKKGVGGDREDHFTKLLQMAQIEHENPSQQNYYPIQFACLRAEYAVGIITDEIFDRVYHKIQEDFATGQGSIESVLMFLRICSEAGDAENIQRCHDLMKRKYQNFLNPHVDIDSQREVFAQMTEVYVELGLIDELKDLAKMQSWRDELSVFEDAAAAMGITSDDDRKSVERGYQNDRFAMIAVTLMRQGDKEGAITLIRREIKDENAKQSAHEALIDVAIEQGKYEEAWEMVGVLYMPYGDVVHDNEASLKVLRAWIASGEVDQHNAEFWIRLKLISFEEKKELAVLYKDYLLSFDFSKDPHRESLQSSGRPYSTWKIAQHLLGKIKDLDVSVYGEAFSAVCRQCAEHGHVYVSSETIRKNEKLRIVQRMTLLAELMPIFTRHQLEKKSYLLPCVQEFRNLRKAYGKIAPGNAEVQTAGEILEAETMLIVALTKIKGAEAGLAEVEEIMETPGTFFADSYIRNIHDNAKPGELEEWKRKTLLKIAEAFAER
jgi:hypothetical protein